MLYRSRVTLCFGLAGKSATLVSALTWLIWWKKED